VKKSFNIQELLHVKSKRHGTKPIQLRFILIFSEETIQCSKTFAPQVQTSWNQAHSATIYFNFQWRNHSRFKNFWAWSPNVLEPSLFDYDLFLFLVKKSFNIQELLHLKSKRHGTKPIHLSWSIAFQIHQELDLKHPGSVDLISTKQNKLPSFIDR